MAKKVSSNSRKRRSQPKLKHIGNKMFKGNKAIKTRTSALGVTDRLINGALTGNEKALRQLGDMAIEGETVKRLMPVIKDQATSFLEGLESYNVNLASIYETGARVGTNIDKSKERINLANIRYNNQQGLIKDKRIYDLNLEEQSTSEAYEMLRVNAYVQYWMSREDHRYALEQKMGTPALKQLEIQLQQNIDKALYLLEYGSNADLSLLPQKDYVNGAKTLPDSESNPIVSTVQGMFRRLWGNRL